MKTRRVMISVFVSFVFLFLLSVSALAGWKTTAYGTRYYTSKTEYVKKRWYKIDGYWFYFDAEGYKKTGRFRVGKNYYYVDAKKGAVKDGKKGNYYYGPKGIMCKNCWVTTKEGYQFYCSTDGKIPVGEFTLDGKTYCCLKSTGKVWARWNKGHYFDKDGVLVTKKWIGDSYVNADGDITKGERNPVNPSVSDVRLLAALVYYEAGNQSYYGKQCVASVVLNRMKNSTFPNTLRGVIYQSGQFTPAMNGCVTYLYNSSQKIQKECIYAARTVLTEGSKLKGYYFFNTYGGDKKIGDHYFSKKYY